MSGPNELAKAKLKVMGRVPYIQKERKQGLNYSFAGEAAILGQLHPAFQEAGLAWAVVGCELVASEQYSTKSGASMNRVLVKATYSLTHAESGQSETIQSIGEGADSGDKATSKAMTSALKYALRQTFLIETGDDPDHTPSEQQERGASRPAQQQAPTQQQQVAKPKQPPPASVRELWDRISNSPAPQTGDELVKWVKSLDASLGRLVPDHNAGELLAAVAQFLRVDVDKLGAVKGKDLESGWNNAKQYVKSCETPAHTGR